eukprot:715278-Hanusia_phi.AAC.1
MNWLDQVHPGTEGSWRKNYIAHHQYWGGLGCRTQYITVPEIEQALVIPRTPVLPSRLSPRSLAARNVAAGTPVSESACRCSDLLIRGSSPADSPARPPRGGAEAQDPATVVNRDCDSARGPVTRRGRGPDSAPD